MKIENFVVGEVDNPKAPSQTLIDSATRFEPCGELFEFTQRHVAFDSRGNNTIKIGRNVPDHGVCLAQYETKHTSMDDMIATSEVDTNTIELEYVEKWIVKRDLLSNDPNQFNDTLNFEGEEDTSLYGFIGLLRRDRFYFEEMPTKYKGPVYRAYYNEYRGLSQTDLDDFNRFYNYKDETYEGELRLSHTIVEAIDFYRRPGNIAHPRTYVCYAKYEGLTYFAEPVYTGYARYSGFVTKRDNLINVNPDKPNEKIMYPREDGILEDINEESSLSGEVFVVTDIFKDNVPLYYKHILKLQVYEPKRSDDTFEIFKAKLVYANGSGVGLKKYKHMFLAKKTDIKHLYEVYLYTSFIPTSAVPMYVLYDGLDPLNVEGGVINPLEIKTDIRERVSVHYALSDDDYTLMLKDEKNIISEIKVKSPQTIYDNRAFMDVGYKVIVDEMYESKTYQAKVMHERYALSSDRGLYINGEQIVSPLTASGFLSARELFVDNDHYSAHLIKEDSVFRIRFDNQYKNTLFDKDEIVIHTDTTGSGVVYAKTYRDTGYGEGGEDVINLLKPYHIYKLFGNIIKKGYAVMDKNLNRIGVSPPIVTTQFEKWHPKVNHARFSKFYHRANQNVEVMYRVNEYHHQFYNSDYPKINVVNEKVTILDSKHIKTKRESLYVEHKGSSWEPSNISVRRVLDEGTSIKLNIEAYDIANGVIELKEHVSLQDNIEVSYVFEEMYYHYKGYFLHQDPNKMMIDINFNPSQYSTYINNSNINLDRERVYDLFNKKVYFFMRPFRIVDRETNEEIERNQYTLYHTIGEPKKEGNFDLLIGVMYFKHYTSKESISIHDARSRGGGVLETISDDIRRKLEPESDMYLDIGTLDGTPYHENSVVVLKADERLLKANGGRFEKKDIENAVGKWGAYGMFPIIEYVKAPNSFENISETIEVSSRIDGVSMYKPFVTSAIYTV